MAADAYNLPRQNPLFPTEHVTSKRRAAGEPADEGPSSDVRCKLATESHCHIQAQGETIARAVKLVYNILFNTFFMRYVMFYIRLIKLYVEQSIA